MWLTSRAGAGRGGPHRADPRLGQHPQRIAGSVDGLLIVDSLGGEPLAERIMQTKGWQEFSLYRAAPHSGPMTVTFALTGLGEAFLDDITIQPIDRPAAATATMPAGMTMQTAPPAAAARPTGPQMDAAIGPATIRRIDNDPSPRRPNADRHDVSEVVLTS